MSSILQASPSRQKSDGPVGGISTPRTAPGRRSQTEGDGDREGRRRQLVTIFLRDVCSLPPGDGTSRVGEELIRELTAETEGLICTRLGHPRSDPGGLAIAEGSCCRVGESGGRLQRLSEIRPGQRCAVEFLVPRPGNRLEYLAPLGIIPGCRILMHRLRPAVVVEVGETTLALDRVIADDIFVTSFPRQS